MSEKNRDSLDKFFQEGLGKHDFEYQEADWLSLEEKLVVADKARVLFWRRIYGSGAGLVAIAGAIFLLNSGDGVNENAGSQVSQVPVVESETNPAPEATIPESVFGTTDEKNNQVALEQNREQIVSGQPGDKINNYILQENIRAEIITEPRLALSGSAREQPLSNPEYRIDSRPAQEITGSTSTPEFVFESVAVAPPVIKEKSVKAPKRNFGNWSRFAVSATWGPELSSTGSSDYYDPGFSTGISGEYFILPKLSINTGVFFVEKVYLTAGEEYAQGQGIWTYGVMPETTIGLCHVLDIPVNLRYYALNGRRHSLFVSGGASSYFFLSEEYRFYYEQNSEYFIQGMSLDNSTQNVFGVANFSIGYELWLRNQFFLQVEPYFKVPVNELGFGNVDLNSAGIFFTLKYRFKKRNESLSQLLNSLD